jgi:tripartite-type tricarboxylate transporter receptor subunit TctC
MKIRSVAAFVAALWLLPIADACAQTGYPNHAVRMVVGYAPGGPLDIIARILSERFAQMWGQPVVVDNLTGASGNIAAERVAKAVPDGYTLFVASNAQLIINPSLYKNIPYDSDKDFVLISQAVFTPNILVVPNDLPVKNVQELVAYAKAHPGLTFASAGVGTTQHLAGEMFKAMAHIDIQHVPYRGASLVVTDLLGGRLSMFFGAASATIPLVRDGKVRALAVTSENRFPGLPELPTMIESGFPGFVSVLSIGLIAPAGTPPAIVEKIHQDAVKVVSDPDAKTKLAAIGMETIGDTPAEFTAAMKAQKPQWAKLIKDAGIKVAE